MAYVRCWTCNGNGIVPTYGRKDHPDYEPNGTCPDCRGTGMDVQKTLDAVRRGILLRYDVPPCCLE